METAKLSKIVRQRDPQLRQVVKRLAASQVKQAIDSLKDQGRVVEIADEGKRLLEIAATYCKRPENTLVISPANQERGRINALIHRQLQRDGKVSLADQQMMVYVNRQDMTGTERTFANVYVPDEDIIRYNRASKVYGFSVGDYARVIATNHEKNEITVQRPDGQETTYNPARLSGVNVYRESSRMFAEGDRIQFRAPFAEHRIANGALGSIGKLTEEELTVALDSGRKVSFEPDKFRHLDHGYAVTSYSSQSQTVDRVLVNADANESDLLLNQRMGYVAVSRAREEAMIFTNSTEQLRAALDRSVDKEMAVEALRESSHRNSVSVEERERLIGTVTDMAPEQSFAQECMSNSSEDSTRNEQRAEEENELQMSS